MKQNLAAVISTGAIALLVTSISLAPANAMGTVIEPETIAQKAKPELQRLTVSPDAAMAPIARDSYTATSMEELLAMRQAAADAEAKRLAEEEAAKKKAETPNFAVAGAPKMNGVFAWPVIEYTIYDWEQNGFHTSERPEHHGLDMLAPAGTPIYAAHDGVVTASQESYGSYGAAVEISGTVDGQQIKTTYAHMTYNTRAVEVGDTVTAGTLIGRVGMTGRATANHLHFEVRINGGLIDPYSWLMTNLG